MVARDIQILSPVPEVSEAVRERATRYVASQAEDADDARTLLQMLGLLPDDTPHPGRATWYRKNVCRCTNCTRAWSTERARTRARKREQG